MAVLYFTTPSQEKTFHGVILTHTRKVYPAKIHFIL